MAAIAHITASAMTDDDVAALREFCRRCGILEPIKWVQIRSGRNSAVYRLSDQAGTWILKRYYRSKSEKRDRLGSEFDFLRYLRAIGISQVAQPLGMDRDLYSAMYSWLPGKRPDKITASHVSQATRFIREINRDKDSASAAMLPLAADAVFSEEQHLRLAETRIQRLLAVEPKLEVEWRARAFVNEKLRLTCSRLQEKLGRKIDRFELTSELPPADRILSPSDFGFHNALDENGQLAFVDFEYAGWDDPAKLVCDFICQPELPISLENATQFTTEICQHLPQPDAVLSRVERLLPTHRLKWCCILLNEFRGDERERRLHAGVEQAGLLTDQLAKAKAYFGTHLEHQS